MKMPLQRVAKDLYLSIALLKECNYKCGYCHPLGESKVTSGKNLTMQEMECIIDAALLSGINRFRFTGGECTVLPWLGDVLAYALNSAPDVHVNICSNGSRLDRYIDLLEFYKDRIDIRVSLDSTSEDHRQAGLDKVLTPKLEEILRELSRKKIPTRINTVITNTNKSELRKIISLATSLGFDLKLLDLYMQDEYISTQGLSELTEPGNRNLSMEYWCANYVDLNDLIPEVESISQRKIEKYSKDGGFGIPMYAFEVDGIKIIFKDSMKGSFFHPDECIKHCSFFGTKCQEGIYTPHVSSNMVLHLNGCHNPILQRNLRDKLPAEILQAFNYVISLFTNLKHIETPPKPLLFHKLDRNKELKC